MTQNPCGLSARDVACDEVQSNYFLRDWSEHSTGALSSEVAIPRTGQIRNSMTTCGRLVAVFQLLLALFLNSRLRKGAGIE